MIAWIDLETTGLDPKGGKILELACILTDMEGQTVAQTHEVIGHDRSEVLSMMDDTCLSMHLSSGLLTDVWARYSGPPQEYGELRTNTEKAEANLIMFLNRNVLGSKKPMLGGSSVHFDRAWLKRHMPKVEAELFYRHVDVSIFKSCYPAMAEEMKGMAEAQLADPETGLPDGPKHRALADIDYSLALYRASRVLMPDKWCGPIHEEKKKTQSEEHCLTGEIQKRDGKPVSFAEALGGEKDQKSAVEYDRLVTKRREEGGYVEKTAAEYREIGKRSREGGLEDVVGLGGEKGK